MLDKFLRITCGALGALCVHFAASAAQPLTLPDAQQRAVERSRELAARQAAIDGAREMAVAAGQLPDPVLTLGVDNLPATGPDRYRVARDFMTMRRISLMQEFTRGDKRALRGERYLHEADRAHAERSMALAQIQRDSALAWLERYYSEAAVAAIAEQVSAAQLELSAAEAAWRAGRGSQADVLAARAALAQLRDAAAERESRVAAARLMLARWIGEASAAPLAPAPAMDAVGLDFPALDTALGHHPDIAALDEQARIAETEARLAEANRRADWSLEVGYSERGPAYADMVSVAVSIPLPWDRAQRQDREAAAKLAAAEQARAERDEMLRAHAAEARAMFVEWQSKRTRSARYREEILPLAGQRVAALLSAFRGGKVSLSEVLTARRAELETRLAALDLEKDTARLWAQLNFLLPDGQHHSAMPSPASSQEAP